MTETWINTGESSAFLRVSALDSIFFFFFTEESIKFK